MSISSGREGGRNRRGSGRRRTSGRRWGHPPGPGADPSSASSSERAGESSEREGGTRSGKGRAPADRPDAPTGEEEYERAKEILLQQLAVSAKSRAQLIEKLEAKEISAETANRLVNRFEELGLINDQEFAEMFVRSRAASRKLARPALRRELAHKGVSSEIVERALEQRDDEAEREDARELVRKKLRSNGDLSERTHREKTTRRLASMLARRGYGPSLAYEVIREEIEAALDPAELDSPAGVEQPFPEEAWDAP